MGFSSEIQHPRSGKRRRHKELGAPCLVRRRLRSGENTFALITVVRRPVTGTTISIVRTTGCFTANVSAGRHLVQRRLRMSVVRATAEEAVREHDRSDDGGSQGVH